MRIKPVSVFCNDICFTFKRRTLCFRGKNTLGRLFYRQHIVRQNTSNCTHNAAFFLFNFFNCFAEHSRFHFSHNRLRDFRQFVEWITRSIIESYYSVVIHNGWIERHIFIANTAIRKFNVSVKLIFAVGRIAHGNTYNVSVKFIFAVGRIAHGNTYRTEVTALSVIST